MCLQFAYRFHDPASTHRPSVADIRDVTFNSEPASPQLLAFKDGKTIFGHEVEELLLARDDTGMPKLARDDVVSFLKVGIYPNLEAEALSKEIAGQLERLRDFFYLPEDTDAHVIKVHVLAAHLREAYKYVLDQIACDLKSQLKHENSEELVRQFLEQLHMLMKLTGVIGCKKHKHQVLLQRSWHVDTSHQLVYH